MTTAGYHTDGWMDAADTDRDDTMPNAHMAVGTTDKGTDQGFETRYSSDRRHHKGGPTGWEKVKEDYKDIKKTLTHRWKKRKEKKNERLR